ncbi:hypothetical protein AURDEDRAFT_173136 [Auricularia subglabra TFB-10046 SS5]|nr:hypothetical protein AURDEDRAFT_173136 [Auricularia subglabra TFB-10046 SS5]
MQDESTHRLIASIPHDLLDSRAGSLRSVTLDAPLLFLPHATISAFSLVVVARITIGFDDPPVAIARVFPSVEELHVRVEPAEHVANVDLSDLSLRLLAIDNYGGRRIAFTHHPRARAPRVQEVKYQGHSVSWYELFGPPETQRLSAHLYHDEDNQITVLVLNAVDTTYRCTFCLPHVSSWRLCARDKTLERLQELRLVALRVDAALLKPLIQPPVALDALRELSVDISNVPYPELLIDYPHTGPGLSEEQFRCALIGCVVIYCALLSLLPQPQHWGVLAALLVCVPIFICALAASFAAVNLWDVLHAKLRYLRASNRVRLSYPSLDSVTMFSTDERPAELCSKHVAPLARLLEQNCLHPELLLSNVRLNRRLALHSLKRHFRAVGSYGSLEKPYGP